MTWFEYCKEHPEEIIFIEDTKRPRYFAKLCFTNSILRGIGFLELRELIRADYWGNVDSVWSGSLIGWQYKVISKEEITLRLL